MVDFTGVSGSGKSSLAFGTLNVEAQQRYLEPTASYARRLFDQKTVPDVDSIDGLPPAVAHQQRRSPPKTLSSVESMTTLCKLLRMLYFRQADIPRGAHMLAADSVSANTVEEACPKCHGIGRVYDVTETSLAPGASRSTRERAIAATPSAWPIPLASRDTTNMRFTLTGTLAAVRFERDGVGRVTGFAVDAGDITNIRFAKLK